MTEELDEFSYRDGYGNWLDQIASSAYPEDWGPDKSYLKYYCDTNFRLAMRQDLVYFDPEDRFALWRIGHLVSQDGAPIYGLFGKNRVPNRRQNWYFRAALARRNPVVRLDSDRASITALQVPVKPPPREPVYEIPDYHPEYLIEYNWLHFLEDRQYRLEDCLPDIDNDRTLYLSIFGAVELAHRHYARYAVPQFYSGRYQYLLPLYITTDDMDEAPDLVAALDEDERGVYIVRTLLLPEWAYSNARSIAKNTAPFRSWIKGLAPV